MKRFMGLTKRNLLIYFKDKPAILFSLLTSLIVLVLYLLFLKGTFEDAFQSALDSAGGISQLIKSEDVSLFVSITLLVGMMGTAMITVPYSCLTTIVKDRENRIDYDICATPVRRWQIILSYFAAAAISACIMTGLLLTVGLAILAAGGGMLPEAADILKAYGIVMLGSVSATAFFMPFMLCFKTSQSSGAFFGMLSAAAGFVIGAFIPLSQFSEGVQTFCNLFPATHVTVAVRNALMSGVLNSMENSIGGLDQGLFLKSIKESFSFSARMLGNELKMSESIFYVLGLTVISCIVMVVAYSKTYRRK
ncbi:MAG: ABC transporter permease [Lachnospiraceae bacterium]|nr:ABC transporter permease [Lachnospiraceae bacterium]